MASASITPRAVKGELVEFILKIPEGHPDRAYLLELLGRLEDDIRFIAYLIAKHG